MVFLLSLYGQWGIVGLKDTADEAQKSELRVVRFHIREFQITSFASELPIGAIGMIG
jgi:hypothetical protein